MSVTTPIRHVIAWDVMTPRQRAEHLVYGHGFDADYFVEQRLTNEQVVERFIVETEPSVPTENYPWPSTGAALHEDDHRQSFTDWADLAHDHSKV